MEQQEMVRKLTFYQCEKCGEVYTDHRYAVECEGDHEQTSDDMLGSISADEVHALREEHKT